MSSYEPAKFPLLTAWEPGNAWIQDLETFGASDRTLYAYASAGEEFLKYVTEYGVAPKRVDRAKAADFLKGLRKREPIRGSSSVRLSFSTVRVKIVALRQLFDYLVEQRVVSTNPFARIRLRDRNRKLPWIPNEMEWRALMAVCAELTLRNRLMLLVAYEGALRREECSKICIDDIDLANREILIRAENSKSKRDRIVPYSPETGNLMRKYLNGGRRLFKDNSALFVSESSRNRGDALSVYTLSGFMKAAGRAVGLPRMTAHTLRHLRLTDMARGGADIYEIMAFAGHKRISSTMIYIHLSARDLVRSFARANGQVYQRHLAQLHSLF